MWNGVLADGRRLLHHLVQPAGTDASGVRLLSRILLIPVLAGRLRVHPLDGPFGTRPLGETAPGANLALQRLTTRRPGTT
jgi:hypothetical protein